MKDERLSDAKPTKLETDAAATTDSGVAQQDAKKDTKSPPKKRGKSFFKCLAGGGGCGGALGVMLLFFWALVTYNATVNAPAVDDNQVASGITTFLGGVVCFGPFFVVLCALLGAAVGFMRWRW